MPVVSNVPSALRRWTLGAVAALTVLATVMVVGALGAPAAQAAGCTSLTHAYLTMPGRALVGYDNLDGVQRGIETFTYTQGQVSFRLGANGVQRGTPMGFFAFDATTGAQVAFIPGRAGEYDTRRANSNCIVNEEGPFTFTLPPGDYRIVARYVPWYFGQGNYINVPVVNLHVLPAPPPPPPVEDPCGPYGCGYDIG